MEPIIISIIVDWLILIGLVIYFCLPEKHEGEKQK